MKTSFGIIGCILGLVVLIILGMSLTFGGRFFSLEMNKFFGTKEQDVKREIFEQSQSYVHGMSQELGKYYAEYQGATQEDREAMKAVIQVRFSAFDSSNLTSPEMKTFLTNMRGF